ncbi:hypothetical protein B0I35DRAFT_446607 [Stachybotrys elegans]|uniref:Cyanovirin-N domain-containing protein n=1 Tax=Stachybotrys elegans TaxID=80388 RepID=A0A8K0S8P0_9HYPO|nr:hypothetical protein B0I35DRAFT_446607 [Stachybotrys elegans]
MIAAKFLLVAMAACIEASPVVSTPVASALEPATTDWKPVPFPSELNLAGIDIDALKESANWNETQVKAFEEAVSLANTSSKPAKDVVSTLSGPCDQGDCPDYSKPFDTVWTLTSYDGYVYSNTALRIGDCGECLRHVLGSNGGHEGGCWDFRSCGRDQLICVDPGNRRAHRTWKGYVKTCYSMEAVWLGSCGLIEGREILRIVREVPCTW